MPSACPAGDHGYMSAATITPVHRHPFSDALRAIKVFAGAAFDVLVLGEYGEEAGVRRK